MKEEQAKATCMTGAFHTHPLIAAADSNEHLILHDTFYLCSSSAPCSATAHTTC